MSMVLDALFEKSIPILAASLNTAVQDALLEYEQIHQTGQKGKLSHIYISFLLSGVVCKLPWLRIDLCDENDRADITECYVCWDVSCISNELYNNVDALAKQNKMKDYEIEQAWLTASSDYSRCFEKILPKIIDQCEAAKTISGKWHFGQYLGSTAVVRENEKDEIF